MPWDTPTLDELRALNRDNVQSQLRSGPMIPNSVMRVMSDSNSGLAYLTLLYINWLALQLMPDTAETEWLDRFGAIWRPGGSARKTATFATGVISVTGLAGVPLPNGSILTATAVSGAAMLFQTTAEITLAPTATPVSFVALTEGATDLLSGSQLTFQVGIAGIDGTATVSTIVDGVNGESDDELRVRVLDRIREPPMGGDAEDYVQWAMAVPGVTRAWSAPNEMGIGTVTVRFMMDNLRATDDPMTNGFPNDADVAIVLAYLQTKRPVAVKDFFCVPPIPEPIDFTILNLEPNDVATQAAIYASVKKMLADKAAPSLAVNGVTQDATEIYESWVSEAISAATGVDHFDLVMDDHPMPSNGCLAVIGAITYV